MPSDSGDLRARLTEALGHTFTVDRELGGGGMSHVFLAEERALGRRVVVKVLAPQIAHELSAERFAREIRLSSQLQHPNIVPILAAGDAFGMPYYTMPYVEGESLRSALKRLPSGESLAGSSAFGVLRDVARALAYAHEHGVVHRDIKPENVLLAFDSAVVADFGVAKATDAARRSGGSSMEVTITQAGTMLGTPAYMSPEQVAGDPDVDHRADLYAWGVLAYEVLSGAHPFADRTSMQAVVRAHLVEQARPLSAVAPHVAPVVSDLVMKCLAKSPADRPESARILLESLAGASEAAVVSGASKARGGLLPRRDRLMRLGRSALAGAVGVVVIWTVTRTLRSGTGAPATAASMSSPPTRSARDLYLRGKVRLSSESRAENEAAISSLRDAIAVDPSFAPAYASLARAYAVKSFYFAADSERKPLIEDAEVAVEKALSLDSKLGEAYFARGLLLWTPARRFPHEEAIRAYRQALAFDSTLDEAHHQLALVYLHLGLFDKARAQIDTALNINPGNTLARFRIGVIDLYRGDFAHAHSVFNSTPLERNPSLWAFQEATALYRLGRDGEAAALIDKFLIDYPRDEGGVGHSVRAMLLAKAGKQREAEAAIATSLELGRTFGHFHHTAYNIASAYALLGQPEQAMQWLQQAVDNGFPCYPLLASDTQLDALRRNPQFVALLSALKRDWEVRRRSW